MSVHLSCSCFQHIESLTNEQLRAQTAKDESSDDDDDVDRQGSWIRRRRLDGALNRRVN